MTGTIQIIERTDDGTLVVYYPIEVVAQRFGVSTRTIRRYVYAGHLTTRRVMERTCIPAAEVEAYMAERTVAAA